MAQGIQSKIASEQADLATARERSGQSAAEAAIARAREAADRGFTREPMTEAAAAHSRALEAQRMAEQETVGPGRGMVNGEERVPFGGAELNLYWPPIPGFRLYWFNDRPGRVLRAKRAGYEHVMDPNTGDPVCRTVGRGDRGEGENAYLMKIPIEWYEQDTAATNAAYEAKMRDIREGRVHADPNAKQYVGTRGIHITSGHR